MVKARITRDKKNNQLRILIPRSKPEFMFLRSKKIPKFLDMSRIREDDFEY